MQMVCPDYQPFPNSHDMEGRVSEATLYTLQQLDNLPVTADQLSKATRNIPLLSKAKQHTLTGWPKNYK